MIFFYIIIYNYGYYILVKFSHLHYTQITHINDSKLIIDKLNKLTNLI